MKNKILFSLLFFTAVEVDAQYKTGEIAFISKGTTVVFDGLALIPANDNFNLSKKTLTKSIAPVKGNLGNSIAKYFSFNESFNFSGTVGITYLPSELNGNSESALQIAYSAQNGEFVTTSDSERDAGQHFVASNFNNESLMKITAVNGNVTLPVTLISFRISLIEDRALLSWNTASEINSDHFEVQHSTNGKVWNVLGKVKAAGESKISSAYGYEHSSPDAGENLYRLKIVDADGTYAFSKIVSIQSEREANMNVYPNPVTDKLTIESDHWKDVQNLEVYNLVGKMVRKLNASDAGADQLKRSFNFQEMPTGIYTLKSTLSSGKTATYKILKK